MLVRFYTTLKDRKIIQTGVIYIASSWGILQAIDFFSTRYNWPTIIFDLALTLLFFGLPFSIIRAWFHGLGDKPKTSLKEAVFISISILVTIVSISYTISGRIDNNIQPKQKSIAVLPFKDLSQTKDQEYFSDGLSEELLNVLNKVPEIKVISRTSSFSFKGKNEDLHTIASKLGVDHILEGSVRKAGNKLRITAQLVRAVDGIQLWSETYDSQVTDIFKIQEEISRAVASKLKVTLLGSRSISTTENIDAYNSFLLGKNFASKSTKKDSELAIKYLKESIALDSNYSPSWAWLGRVYSNQLANGHLFFTQERLELAKDALEKAIRIDSSNCVAFAWQGVISMDFERDLKKADVSIKKAMKFNANNEIVLWSAAVLSSRLGDFEKAIELYKKSIEADPLRASSYQYLAKHYYYLGKTTEAELTVRKLLEIDPPRVLAHCQLALIQLDQNKNNEALSSALQEVDDFWKLTCLVLVYHKLKQKDNSDKTLKLLIEKYESEGTYQIAEAYAYRGEVDLAFQWLEKAYSLNDAGLVDAKFDPRLKNLRNDVRWRPFLKKIGIS